jgi:hypothetical protein
MSFLDNLENNLKALESQEERDPAKRQREMAEREAEREAARLAAPHVEALKNGPYTQQLMSAARTVGHRLRVFVDIAWIGTTLRLEARGRRLELRPTADGIVAAYFEGGEALREEALDLSGAPEDLVRLWLEG